MTQYVNDWNRVLVYDAADNYSQVAEDEFYQKIQYEIDRMSCPATFLHGKYTLPMNSLLQHKEFRNTHARVRAIN